MGRRRAVARHHPGSSLQERCLDGDDRPLGLRFVSYPISRPEPETGLATINWIANLNYEPGQAWNKEDWNREASLEDFLPRFEAMRFDWLDVPDLVRRSDKVFEYPMVDRDPLPRWTHGRATLMGDAAHAHPCSRAIGEVDQPGIAEQRGRRRPPWPGGRRRAGAR